VLRACRRLLRPGGRLAFLTILIAPGLPARMHRQAAAAGPSSATTPDLMELVERAGFADVRLVDVTGDYLDTARAWLAARERHRDELRPLDPADYDERIAKGRAAISAIEQGLLRRALGVASRP
jgi:cyclopropane fatty-acyl-phospholipid synthase-like methyltransferase